jgi:hypothetical protein
MSIYDKYTPPAGNGGLFLKLNDGDVVRLRVIGDPIVYENKGKEDGKLTTRYSWPVYNFDEEKVQILSGGATIFNEIAAIAQDDDFPELSKQDIKIKRTGSGFSDTKYAVSAPPKGQELPEDLEQLDLVAIQSKSDFSLNVQTLEDRINGVKPADAGDHVKGKDNLPSDEDMDKPIDLDEIPF